MFEALFYFTGALSIAALTILLTRHESLGALKSEIEAFKAQNAELRKKLKDEAENSNHLLRRLTEQYDEAIQREQKKVEEARSLHNEFKVQLLEALKASDVRVAKISRGQVVEDDFELSPDDPQNRPR